MKKYKIEIQPVGIPGKEPTRFDIVVKYPQEIQLGGMTGMFLGYHDSLSQAQSYVDQYNKLIHLIQIHK